MSPCFWYSPTTLFWTTDKIHFAGYRVNHGNESTFIVEKPLSAFDRWSSIRHGPWSHMFLFLTEVWSESEDIFLADMSREACLNLLLQRRNWTFGRLLASGWQRCDNLYDIRVTFESDASKSLCSCSISVQPSLVYYAFQTLSLSLSLFLLSCQQHKFNFGGVGQT